MDSRILPELFADAYERLWDRAFRDGGVDGNNHPLNGSAGVVGVEPGNAVGQWRVSSGEAELTIAKKASGDKAQTKQVGKTARTLRDERAFRLKTKMDKRLRAMAREICAALEGRNTIAATHRVCTGRCKKFGEVEWDYCARCGGPMREMEEDE